MTSALRSSAFRRLAALYTLDFVLEWFGTVALMVLVYDATNSPLAASGMLLSKQLAPVALVPLFMDRLDAAAPRIALSMALAGQAAALFAFAAFGYGPWLFVLAALAGTLGVLFRAGLRGTLARTLEGSALRGANAVINVAIAVAAALGPALAAWATSTLGSAGALTVGAVGGVVLAFVALTVRPGLAGGVPDDGDDHLTPAHRQAPALSYGALLVFAGVLFCVCAMDEPALLAYSEDSLGAGVGGYGAIYVAWGIGAALGSLIFARLLARSMLAVAAWGAVLVGVAYLGMGLSGGIAITCGLAVIGGAGNGIGFVALVTAVQEAAPRGAEIRVASKLETISTAAPALGVLAGGVLTEFAGPRFALGVPGVACIVAVALAAAATQLRGRRPIAVSSPRLFPTTPGGSV